MKNIVITTTVNTHVEKILSSFSKETMQEATPPFINLEVTRFDGNDKGDRTQLITSICGHYQSWAIEVKTKKVYEDRTIIITEGVELPFPFTSWFHTYHLKKVSTNKTKIYDNIKYSTGNFIFDLLMYPIVYLVMYYRKPVLMDKYNKEVNI